MPPRSERRASPPRTSAAAAMTGTPSSETPGALAAKVRPSRTATSPTGPRRATWASMNTVPSAAMALVW